MTSEHRPREDDVQLLAFVAGIDEHEALRRLQAHDLELTEEQSEAFHQQLTERDWERLWNIAEAGDLAGALKWVDSLMVASRMLQLADELEFTDDQLRAALRTHWPRVHASGWGGGMTGAQVGGMLALFRKVGFVSDTSSSFGGELTIYRGTIGDDPLRGLSWTLREATAQFFAQSLARRGTPSVWRARVDAEHLLGYFVDRDEQEVIPDPACLRDLERLPVARRA